MTASAGRPVLAERDVARRVVRRDRFRWRGNGFAPHASGLSTGTSETSHVSYDRIDFAGADDVRRVDAPWAVAVSRCTFTRRAADDPVLAAQLWAATPET